MSNHLLSLISLLTIVWLAGCQPSHRIHEDNVPALLQKKAFDSNLAYELVESLTVEVGPRLAGSEKDPIAVEWAIKKLTSLNFDRVYKEPVQVPVWERGEAKASITFPYSQPLVITALGGSVGTPSAGITAHIVRFDSLASLEKASTAEVSGKIVFIDQLTERHKTSKGYVKSAAARLHGASVAAQKGALAVINRTVGTSQNRIAQTGMVQYQDGIDKIPAVAISAPDAELINAMLRRGHDVEIKLQLSSKSRGFTTSFNVIAEVTGSSKPEELVLISAHLDSWDEGTGASDDGAGVAIVTAAAKLIQDLPAKPARTVRVVLFAAEEVGYFGARAYAKDHQEELDKHYIAAESDFGAAPVYQIDFGINNSHFAEIIQLVQPMTANGVAMGNNSSTGGPDVSFLHTKGVPVASLRQDGTDYFDYHHSPNDTLDKIDPVALQQNVTAYAQFAYLMAQSKFTLRPISND
ncbi:M20/M25/M40 family metallo-hydrolase [Endozoicomonas atrinae]|uniref:M20/M25/M40 family metallo-hydrolase n=1 Tax=Endozoicomonas atrinae TaxID=1333660 RepID=UPI000825A20B|nr:M20/M25/M40 family metallo-hydrolase [Endozoicomonas atrinae]